MELIYQVSWQAINPELREILPGLALENEESKQRQQHHNNEMWEQVRVSIEFSSGFTQLRQVL
jgi:hypothetical protein